MLLIFFFNGSSSDSSWTKSGQTFADIQHRGKCSPLRLVCIETGNPKSNGLNPTWNLSIPHTVIPMLFHLGSQTSHTSAVMGFAADAYCAAFLKQTSSWCNPQGYLDGPDFCSEAGQEKQNYGHLILSGDISGIVEVPTILWMVAKSCTTWDARKHTNNGILPTY